MATNKKISKESSKRKKISKKAAALSETMAELVVTKEQVSSKKLYKLTLDNIKWSNSKTKFSYLAGINRSVNPAHVTKLAKSVEKMGVIRPIVVTNISFITGKPTLYIIDGQHLFNACIRLGYDVPYVTINLEDKQELVETIALLNSSSKTWCTADYVTAWSTLKEDYIKLNHYYQVYDLELMTIASILNNGTESGTISKKIKNGSFSITNEQENVNILNYLTDMLKIVPRMNRFENKYACAEYVKFLRSVPNYDHKSFLAKLQKNKDKFILATQEEGKLSELFRNLA